MNEIEIAIISVSCFPADDYSNAHILYPPLFFRLPCLLASRSATSLRLEILLGYVAFNSVKAVCLTLISETLPRLLPDRSRSSSRVPTISGRDLHSFQFSSYATRRGQRPCVNAGTGWRR